MQQRLLQPGVNAKARDREENRYANFPMALTKIEKGSQEITGRVEANPQSVYAGQLPHRLQSAR
ncbi:hypothetical protein ACM7Q1_09555 [Paenibacillus illinoisensis]|uniref:hypothetical protein n=1 Tax=Paenibacillus illinoisensis TaxID=59845 RepID=UPI003A4DB0CD